MDPLGGVIARLDQRSPTWADRLRWRRERREDMALRVVDAFVSRGDVVIDAGASKGLYTARMRDLVGARGMVHSFEPNPQHHARLESLAARGAVTVHPVALSDHAGEARLHTPLIDGHAYDGWASLEAHHESAVSTIAVATMRLDDAIAADEAVRFVKCDVEGHEDSVMRGAEGVLTRSRPRVLVEIEQRHRSSEIGCAFDAFAALGYAGWALFPGGLRPLEQFDQERDQLSFLSGGTPDSEVLPRGYVHNFLFLADGEDPGSLRDPAAPRP